MPCCACRSRRDGMPAGMLKPLGPVRGAAAFVATATATAAAGHALQALVDRGPAAERAQKLFIPCPIWRIHVTLVHAPSPARPA